MEKILRKAGKVIVIVTIFLTMFKTQSSISLAAKTIATVKIEMEADGFDSEGMPILSAETDDSKYSSGTIMTFSEYEAERDDKQERSLIINHQAYSETKDRSEMVYALELTASSGYTFLSGTKIKLSGKGAVCVDTERNDDKTVLTVYVKLKDINNMLGEIDTASFKEDKRAVWAPAQNAVKYELRLFCEGKIVANKKITGGESYDLGPLMKKKGSYRFFVRPVSATNQWGTLIESGEFYLLETPETMLSKSGWQQAEGGRFQYFEKDGSYLQKNWLFENGVWYFFDEEGFLQTDTYIKWGRQTYYVNQSGNMIMKGKAPDGRLAEPSGTLKWPES